jgi:hypothetical protein
MHNKSFVRPRDFLLLYLSIIRELGPTHHNSSRDLVFEISFEARFARWVKRVLGGNSGGRVDPMF